MPFASVSVNISRAAVFDTRCPIACGAPGFCWPDGSQLELEITESVLGDNTGETQSVFAGLKALGVKLSIDDFGTGFSSLAYLKASTSINLKIDHSLCATSAPMPTMRRSCRPSLARSLQCA